MSKAKAIVEAAAYTALAAAVTRAAVYQDAPATASGPLVILGELRSFAMPGKGADDDRRVRLSIGSLVVAEERAPLLAIQEEIETALDGAEWTQDGWTLAFAFVEDDAVLEEDGETYSGVTLFEVLAIAP